MPEIARLGLDSINISMPYRMKQFQIPKNKVFKIMKPL